MSGLASLLTGWHPLQQDDGDRVQARATTLQRGVIIRKRKPPQMALALGFPLDLELPWRATCLFSLARGRIINL